MLARVPSRLAPSTRSRALAVAISVAIFSALFAHAAPDALGAVGAGGAFSELVESQQTTTTTVATTATESSSTSNSTTLIVVALIAAVLLLMVIAFVIVRDARRVAPVTDSELARRGSRDQAVRMRQRRAKAKAARRQRKRTR
jgi:hypothetical protein